MSLTVTQQLTKEDRIAILSIVVALFKEKTATSYLTHKDLLVIADDFAKWATPTEEFPDAS